MNLPSSSGPIVELKTPYDIELFLKREDVIGGEISGNKYWKLFYPVRKILKENPEAVLYSVGGAYSNHIAALAALGELYSLPTVGIIRGEEHEKNLNPTLLLAKKRGMKLCFVSRDLYRDKEALEKEVTLEDPNAYWIPEGGSSPLAVEGIKHMLNVETQRFDYLCSAVGSGGTLGGISLFKEAQQKALGFTVVKDPTLEERIRGLCKKGNFELIESSFGGYGKMPPFLIEFINEFYELYQIPLDPIYTGKMMKALLEKIEEGHFPRGSRILAFHTGGLQGIAGANEWLRRKKREEIKVSF